VNYKACINAIKNVEFKNFKIKYPDRMHDWLHVLTVYPRFTLYIGTSACLEIDTVSFNRTYYFVAKMCLLSAAISSAGPAILNSCEWLSLTSSSIINNFAVQTNYLITVIIFLLPCDYYGQYGQLSVCHMLCQPGELQRPLNVVLVIHCLNFGDLTIPVEWMHFEFGMQTDFETYKTA